jgi:hypothetical protein
MEASMKCRIGRAVTLLFIGFVLPCTYSSSVLAAETVEESRYDLKRNAEEVRRVSEQIEHLREQEINRVTEEQKLTEAYYDGLRAESLDKSNLCENTYLVFCRNARLIFSSKPIGQIYIGFDPHAPHFILIAYTDPLTRDTRVFVRRIEAERSIEHLVAYSIHNDVVAAGRQAVMQVSTQPNTAWWLANGHVLLDESLINPDGRTAISMQGIDHVEVMEATGPPPLHADVVNLRDPPPILTSNVTGCCVSGRPPGKSRAIAAALQR